MAISKLNWTDAVKLTQQLPGKYPNIEKAISEKTYPISIVNVVHILGIGLICISIVLAIETITKIHPIDGYAGGLLFGIVSIGTFGLGACVYAIYEQIILSKNHKKYLADEKSADCPLLNAAYQKDKKANSLRKFDVNNPTN